MSRSRDTANQINRVNSSAADATAITVDSSENVGIGTSTPSRQVSIVDSTNPFLQLALSSDNTANSGLEIVMDANGAYFQNRENTPTIFSTNNTERMRILSGGGITFNGDTAAANALNDYEEGTFTPSVSVGSASTASGVYTKVGRLVTIQCRVNGWSNTSNNEVQLITNLPFTIVETSRAVGSAMWDAVDTDNSYGVVYAVSGNSLAFYSASRNGGFDSIRCIDMDNSGTTVHFFATYMAT